jgi:dTDP-4-dehydrorhamnose reductase
MKILVLGVSGLTGYKSAILTNAEGFEVYGTYNTRNIPRDIQNVGTFLKMNVNKKGELAKTFDEIRPNIVINCMALHNVDYCEKHPEEAFYVNSEIVAEIAALSNIYGTRFIHISTDYIFDGKKQLPYVEIDKPNPLNVYAQSKLNGENNARKADSYSIIRPSVVYGWTPIETQGSTSSSGKPMNFALWVIHKLKNGDALKMVKDQYSSPTLADTLASAILTLATKRCNDTFHVAGNTCLNRYEFTSKIALIMGYRQATINPIESSDFGQIAKRPLHSCLDCKKIEKELNIELPTVDESLFTMRSQVKSESPSLLGND